MSKKPDYRTIVDGALVNIWKNVAEGHFARVDPFSYLLGFRSALVVMDPEFVFTEEYEDMVFATDLLI